MQLAPASGKSNKSQGGMRMKKFVVCPHCGQKLCKAETASEVEMICPSCKKPIEVLVKDNMVITKLKEVKQAAS